MDTLEIIVRMENLCDKLSLYNYTCCTRQWNKEYRKGYQEAVETIKKMLEAEIEEAI